MKIKIGLPFLTAVIFFIISGCGKEKRSSAETTPEINTTQTLGLAYLEENKLNEAEKEFLKLTDLDPDNSMGYANLGLIYLRKGAYEEAEELLKKAINLDPENADIRLLLAKTYEVTDQLDLSLRELENILQFAPNHVRTLYSLYEFYSRTSDPQSLCLREQYLLQVAGLAPENILPKLQLVKIALQNDRPDEMLTYLDAIRQQYLDFPEDAQLYYSKTLEALREEKREEALITVRTLHNVLKVTSQYQAGVHDLKERGGLIGFPVIMTGNANSRYRQE